jgi:hypothetical protein
MLRNRGCCGRTTRAGVDSGSDLKSINETAAGKCRTTAVTTYRLGKAATAVYSDKRYASDERNARRLAPACSRPRGKKANPGRSRLGRDDRERRSTRSPCLRH